MGVDPRYITAFLTLRLALAELVYHPEMCLFGRRLERSPSL
jgi:hypothetical protein